MRESKSQASSLRIAKHSSKNAKRLSRMLQSKTKDFNKLPQERNKIMISYYKKQEQISERQRAEMKAKAGKPVKFYFRSAEELRADWAKAKAKKTK